MGHYIKLLHDKPVTDWSKLERICFKALRVAGIVLITMWAWWGVYYILAKTFGGI